MSVLRHDCSGAACYMNTSPIARADENANVVGYSPSNVDPKNRPSTPHTRRRGVSPLVLFEVVLFVLCAVFVFLSWRMGRSEEMESRTDKCVLTAHHYWLPDIFLCIDLCMGP